MTRGSIQEYREAMRERYLRAGKKDKGRILDEFVNVAGYHRKSVIRLLHRRNQGNPGRRRGRPRRYGCYIVEALKVVWEAILILFPLQTTNVDIKKFQGLPDILSITIV